MQLLHSIKSRRDAEEGFTLIELMVVVLIIAILIAIAIPTFLGARQRAQDRAAQSDLRNGLTAEKTFHTDSEEYSADTAAAGELDSIEPSLQWGTAPAVTVGDVVAANDDNAVVCLEQASKSGTFFILADVATGGGAGTYYNKGAATVACPTSSAAAPAGWTVDGW